LELIVKLVGDIVALLVAGNSDAVVTLPLAFVALKLKLILLLYPRLLDMPVIV
jgi:hypothetical protein